MDEQELKELKVSIYERLRRAIKEGEKEKAMSLVEEIERNRRSSYTVFLTWIDILVSFLADRLGEEVIYEIYRVFDQRVTRSMFEWAFLEKDPEERLRKRALGWSSYHGVDIDEIEEDEEKFILKFRCPTGGTIRRQENFGKTKKGHPWSHGQKGFCYYCSHCVTSFEMMGMERHGSPAWVGMPQPEGRCIQYIYKRKEGVPAEYYKQVGMKKELSG